MKQIKKIILIIIKNELILANLFDFVNSLPNKVETVVGERSSKISGGQKTKNRYCESFISKTSDNYFDESTNSLDRITERKFLKTMKMISEKGYTIIMITHKHEVLKYCNKVVEINNGTLKRIK